MGAAQLVRRVGEGEAAKRVILDELVYSLVRGVEHHGVIFVLPVIGAVDERRELVAWQVDLTFCPLPEECIDDCGGLLARVLAERRFVSRYYSERLDGLEEEQVLLRVLFRGKFLERAEDALVGVEEVVEV